MYKHILYNKIKHFLGTLTISPETYDRLIRAIAEELDI